MEVSQQSWARVAGSALLAIIVFGFAGMLIGDTGGDGSAVQRAIDHELRFRIGRFFEFLMLNSDMVLAVALYGLLRPINAPLALLGTLWRCANAVLLGVGVVAALTALNVVSAQNDFVGLNVEQIHALANQNLHIRHLASPVGLLFWSMGASLHSYLLWRSRYIPRLLSGAYLAVAMLILLAGLACMISPSLQELIDPWYVFPDLPVELAVALWMILKGAKISLQDNRQEQTER